MPPPDGAAAGSAGLPALIEAQLDTHGHGDDPNVLRLLDEIQRRHGRRVAAVLLYGSYLRGKRDTLLDFYVLFDRLEGALPRLERWGNQMLPPNVYYLSLPAEDGPALRAKYATMTLDAFAAAMGDFHSYFWSRFTQPAGMIFARDPACRRRVVAALGAAVQRFAREVAPAMSPPGQPFTAAMFWQRGLALTYACELRSESPGAAGTLYRHDAEHFDALLAACAETSGSAVVRSGQGYASDRLDPHGARRRWALRRLQGKLLSVLRLVKAAATFDDPLDYLLWKIERHSGIYIAPSERQRRHPLVFAWPLLWRLYRRGAFR